jgi:hypothetical protein
MKRCVEGAKMILGGGRTFLDGFRVEIPLQQKTLISCTARVTFFTFLL